jgi:Anti-sigma factor NepR
MSENIKKGPPPAVGRSAPDRPMARNVSISVKLRELYGAVEDEAIPERFLVLLDKLDKAEQEAQAVVAK